MTTTVATTTLDRRTGLAAVIAGTLLFAAVAAEMVYSVEDPDGTVTNRGMLAAYLVLWVIGAAALVVALRGLGTAGTAISRTLPRSGRIGRVISLVGAGLLMAFGVVMLASLLLTGRPAGASFVLFGLGLLLSVIGLVLFGLGLRRSGGVGPWWLALIVAAAGALVAVLVFADPWHDLGLFAFDAAWVALGLHGVRHNDRR